MTRTCIRPDCYSDAPPSKVDPRFCAECAKNYQERGWRLYPLCGHWTADDGTQRRRCPPCHQTHARARKRERDLRYKQAHPDRIQARLEVHQARVRARYATDAAFRAHERARARRTWAVRYAANPAPHIARVRRYQQRSEYFKVRARLRGKMRQLQRVRGAR